ncbi:hypothetical protein DYB36_002715 [Aphanomyces astaci]|uniref:PDZ domain-containing protein n=1 Tax=Aphanomyces astaci TaxID=112090 RepID=A0A397B226_APHAT|nr:hypothetical protein DYB36_002715 [Aphanomyces astaci]
MRRQAWWRVVPFAFVGMAAAVVAAGGMQQCGGGIALEYVVVVNTTDPLGMLLSDKLHVLSFAQDENGRDRVIEASGLVEVGDVLVGVNDLLTDGTALSLVVDWIREADVPKKLTFRAHNSTRCIPLDHVQVASQGDQQSTRMYALASEFGDVIACELYPIVLADPAHACVPLNNNVTGRYLAELAASATATAPAAIQVVVSDTCADRFRDPTVVAMTMSEKHALLVEATSGDLTIVTQDGPRTAEFVNPAASAALDLAQHPLVIVTGNLCLLTTSLVWVQGFFVLAKAHPSCPIDLQVDPSKDGIFHAYASQYEELQVVADPSNWPASARGRHVLYHRLRKAMADSDHKLNALDQCYQAAELHHEPPISSTST